MYQITQFRPALYLLVLLGMAGFALAAQSPLALIIGGGGVAINFWLVRNGRFRPLPRTIANLITLGSMLVVGRQLLQLHEVRDPTSLGANPVLIIGHFLVALQLVKLWEQRLNRDYGQLLVLGLLQMVAASINTNRLAFALLFLVYLLLSLYCCLLFHLKVETEQAALHARRIRAGTRDKHGRLQVAQAKSGTTPVSAASAEPPQAWLPVVAMVPIRHERKLLNRSMRRLSAMVAIYAAIAAVLTFLFFPRGPTNGVLAQSQLNLNRTQTGYTDSVNFSQIAPLLADDRVVGHASVTRNGRPLLHGDTIYLRGATNSRYGVDGSQNSRRDYLSVFVGRSIAEVPTQLPPLNDEQRRQLAEADPRGADLFALKMSIASNIGANDLFAVSACSGGGSALAFPQWFQSHNTLEIRYGGDATVRSPDLPKGNPERFEYELTSSSHPRTLDPLSAEMTFYRGRRVAGYRVNSSFHTLQRDQIIIRVGSQLVDDMPESVRKLAILEGYYGGQPVTVLERDIWDPSLFLTYAFPGLTGRKVYRGGPLMTNNRIPTQVEDYVREYASKPGVSGEDENGQPLVAKRDRSVFVHPLDDRIAQSIERHLKTQFTYSTDITDAKNRATQDPIVWFLSEDGRRGHCEYFAWAMALMCQSLGMDARVVLGFKCDEYNPFSQQFVVKQLHAHAWVEVLTTEGWRTYDPTSGRGSGTAEADYGTWQQFRHMFDWLETAYANHIIYYSGENRENLIQTVESEMTRPLYAGVNEGWITHRFADSRLYQMLMDPGAGTVAFLAMIIILLMFAWMLRRWMRGRHLRARAERIGLSNLSPEEQRRLALQLGFYDDLLTALERRKITRQLQQTPQEFARSLLFLPAEVYETIHRLTEIFYRVRYGRQELSDGLCRRLVGVVGRVDEELTPVQTGSQA